MAFRCIADWLSKQITTTTLQISYGLNIGASIIAYTTDTFLGVHYYNYSIVFHQPDILCPEPRTPARMPKPSSEEVNVELSTWREGRGT